jgi:hypothetical protein
MVAPIQAGMKLNVHTFALHTAVIFGTLLNTNEPIPATIEIHANVRLPSLKNLRAMMKKNIIAKTKATIGANP